MHRQPFLSILAIALLGYGANARATETAVHNDMDGDGRSDLVWRNASTGAMVYWSAANSAAPVTVRVRSESSFIYDPRAWIPVFALSAYWQTPTRNALLLRDVSGQTETHLYPDDAYLPALNYFFSPVTWTGQSRAHGDFDGNGTGDVYYRDQTGVTYIIFDFELGDWGAMSQAQPAVGPDWNLVDAGDFDGDAQSDILWRNRRTGQNVIWRSANPLLPVAVPAASLAWKVGAIGDFNGDGKSDIFWRNSVSGADVLWYSGASANARILAPVTDLRWQVTATGDFDKDGKSDLFWRNAVTGANVIWRSANYGTRMTVSGVTNLAWSTLM